MKPYIIPLTILGIILFPHFLSSAFADFSPYNLHLPVNEDKKILVEFIGKVSAYNVGDPFQNDDSPCIGASMIDLCKMVDKGLIVIANRQYIGHTACLEGIGCGRILDSMNIRYNYKYFDLAMPLEDKQIALEWGRKDIKITIYE